ncbi:MAG: hypothetical protein KBC91_06835, partial [Candidatus Omnitrophica bacterium]|nr:hypothetical protein [Candidatus Omnitrophota bacterium]
LASAHWTWAKTAERLGKITAALTYDQVSSELRTIRWAEVVSTNGGWEALGENRILPADTYTYESEAIQIVRVDDYGGMMPEMMYRGLKMTLAKQANGKYYITEHLVSPFAEKQAGIKTTLDYLIAMADCMVGAPCPPAQLQGGYLQRWDTLTKGGVKLSEASFNFNTGLAHVTLEGIEDSIELEFKTIAHLLDQLAVLEQTENKTMQGVTGPVSVEPVLVSAPSGALVTEFLNRKPFAPYVSPVLRPSERKSERKVFAGLRPEESRKKKYANRRQAEPKYEETVIRFQPLQIAGSAASDASMETWMSQMARGGVPSKD